MREILFRGKRTDNEEWLEGGVVCGKHGEVYITGFTDDSFDSAYVYIITEQAIPKTVGQYTGQTDKNGKNGKKIFEGDIGRYKQTDGAKENGKPIICTGVVLYNEKTASFAVESKDEKGRKYFDYFPIKDFEVIGNIHDNPELLNGE